VNKLNKYLSLVRENLKLIVKRRKMSGL